MIEFWKLRAELRMLGSFDPLEMALTRKNTILFSIPEDRVHVISNTKVLGSVFQNSQAEDIHGSKSFTGRKPIWRSKK
jgi:hypothetical protein